VGANVIKNKTDGVVWTKTGYNSKRREMLDGWQAQRAKVAGSGSVQSCSGEFVRQPTDQMAAFR
jgi:hypothetical protein